MLNKPIFLFLGTKADREMTILLGLAIAFVICQFLPIVGDVHTLIGTLGGSSIDGIRPFNMHIENCITVGHFMLMLNSSVNFVFYMANTDEYRQEFFRVSLTYVLRLMGTELRCDYSNTINLILFSRRFVAVFSLATILK